MTAYSEKLRDPRWQKKRLEILERDNWKCSFCGDDKTTLHVHHEEYIGRDPWDAPADSLKAACEDCHSIVKVYECLQKNGIFVKAEKIRSAIPVTDFAILISWIVQEGKELIIVVKDGDRYTMTPVSLHGTMKIRDFLSDF